MSFNDLQLTLLSQYEENNQLLDRLLKDGTFGIVPWDDSYATSLYKELVNALEPILNHPNERLKYEGIAFISKNLMDLFLWLFGSYGGEVKGKELIYTSLISSHGDGPLLWSKLLLFHSNYFNQFFDDNQNVDIIIPFSTIAVSNIEKRMLIKLPEIKIDTYKVENDIIKNIPVGYIGIKSVIVKDQTGISNLSNNPITY